MPASGRALTPPETAALLVQLEKAGATRAWVHAFFGAGHIACVAPRYTPTAPPQLQSWQCDHPQAHAFQARQDAVCDCAYDCPRAGRTQWELPASLAKRCRDVGDVPARP